MPASSSRRPRPSRDGILAAAEALFGARGFAEPSLRDLLTAAGCSTTAFYARFADPSEVLSALVSDLFDTLQVEAADALAEARSLAHGFEIGVDVLLAVIVPRKGLVRVALTEGTAVPETATLLASAYAGLAALLARGLVGRVPDPDTFAWALVGAIDVQVRRWAVFGTLTDDALAPALRATAQALLPDNSG